MSGVGKVRKRLRLLQNVHGQLQEPGLGLNFIPDDVAEEIVSSEYVGPELQADTVLTSP